MMYAYLIKSRKNSGKPNLFVWFESKSDSRADREVMNILEDAEIETGRGADHQLPVRTDMPVFDDLPEEGVLEGTWCDRYELGENAKTWQKIVVAGAPAAEATTVTTDVAKTTPTLPETVVTTGTLSEPAATADSAPVDKDLVVDANDDNNTEYPVAEMNFSRRLLSQFTSDATRHHIKHAQRVQIMVMSLDTDDSYVQNLLLAASNAPELQSISTAQLWKYTDAIKTVFPMDKHHELNHFLQFTNLWVSTEHIDRGILVREWANGNRITSVQRTDTGTNAGGGNQTDRSPDLAHTLDTLDVEIACALLPMDFDIYNIPGGIYRRGKQMVSDKESPWKEWSRKLRHCAGILDYSRAAIFAVVRSAAPDIHKMPGTHQAWINAKLIETDHANPSAETLAMAMRSPVVDSASEQSSVDDVNKQLAAARGEYVEGISDPSDPKWVHEDLSQTKSEQPVVANIGGGMFSIEGLMGAQNNSNPVIKTTSNEVEKEEIQPVETVANEQMEATDSNQIAGNAEIPASEGIDADGAEAVAMTETSQPTAEVEHPAYFEPGRYEGLPNEVYHAANGISSTQVKDARISLMYFQGRHITKTIGRETSDALTFGTLVHALALEPESFDAEFAVFPGIPAGTFTTTDSMKTFIREYNEGKDKAEQLKLTGTKDVLAASIRAVKSDAIFADEFEQQWRDANQDKIILSAQQLTQAKAIQQALFNHPSAGQLLQHPNRSNEVSYFGMDEETGLEVRVRPDLEIDMSAVRIGVDLKTISLGKVKQDFLRAKLLREIIERDYHLSAAMYCDVADFNQFFWIFVNKDEGYHWVAIIEASEELLELGRLEYRKAMNAISNALDTNVWPAPITDDYTDELNDFDMRRLEALRLA